MGKSCYFCGKKLVSGWSASHSKKATHRFFKPNLQIVRALINGVKKKVYACTKCIKKGKFVKVV